jgi:cold shock CspA family protein/ribosome-associated translation inhibitor RaiA
MTIPCEIAFRHVERSAEIEEAVIEHVEQLERFCRRILHCRVMVEAPNQRHRTGDIYHVRVDLSLPGRKIVVKRDPPAHQPHEDLDLAIHDAFHAARRQVEDHVRERRHEVKWHEAPPHGRVVRLLADDGYGFLEAPDGHEVYFHRDSVLDGKYGSLHVGDEVRYAEEDGEKGPQASTVVPVGRHHHELPRAPSRP